MKIKFWGTRGSIPTPSTGSFLTKHFGGDTTCLTLEYGEDGQIIFDAGSGIRLLGLELAARKCPQKATFFFTHVHWDHIQGFPFFIPSFIPGNTFDLYGPALLDEDGYVGSILEKALRGQQQDLNFPVQLHDMPATMNFHDLDTEETIHLENGGSKLAVTCSMLNHPGGCFSYRVEEVTPDGETKIFTLATDTEQLEDLNPSLQKTSQNTDLLVYDGQYTPDEYAGKSGMPKKGWGHSTWEWGIREALAAKAKKLVLTHHDPLHDDDFIRKLEADAKEAGDREGIDVIVAHQFQEFDL